MGHGSVRLPPAPTLLVAVAVCVGLGCDPGGEPSPAAAQPPASPAPEAPEAEPAVRALVRLAILDPPPARGRPLTGELERAIAEGLRQELDVEVDRLPRQRLPAEAWYPPRRRYRAERLLDHLRPRLADEPNHVRVLGFTSVDISTTKGRHRDWGIFGLGDLGGRAAVLSTFRLRRRARDEHHLRFRVVTTAIHEVGHTLGLPHCTEDRCVMNDAHGSIATVDRSTGHLGPGCRAALTRLAPRRHPPGALDRR